MTPFTPEQADAIIECAKRIAIAVVSDDKFLHKNFASDSVENASREMKKLLTQETAERPSKAFGKQMKE